MRRFTAPRDEAGAITSRTPPSTEPRGARGARFARLLGAVGMLALTVVLFWLVTDDGFRVSEADVSITGVRFADASAVREHIGGIARYPSIFRVRASDIVHDLGALPEVRFARASVKLPAEVTVEVVERRPLFIWSNGAAAWFVDDAGVLFSPREAAAVVTAASERAEAEPAIDAAAAEQPAGVFGRLPILKDARNVEQPLVSGDRLPAIDFKVMWQLLSVTPELLGSRAEDISLRIDEQDGYVLESDDLGWQAVFGHYRANIQPPEHVPRQVQCLTELLGSRTERKIDRVRLVVSGDLCGTFRLVGSKGAGA